MLSVIVVSFNTRDLLRICLASVRRFEPGAELVVVDNDSGDGSANMVRQEFPEVRLIQAGKNLGFAAANNVGLEHATQAFIVFLNSDTELHDDSLTRCRLQLVAQTRLGAVHPRLVGADGHPQRCEYPLPNFWDEARVALRQPRREIPQPCESWLAGTALMVRREALSTVGGKFDNGYFIYWEDADLSAQLRTAGWDLAVVEDALVRHVGGASGGGPDASRRTDLFAWFCHGKYRWFRRNRPIWEVAGIWMLDAVDVPRKYVRGLLRPSIRRREWATAHVTAKVMTRVLFGLKPKS